MRTNSTQSKGIEPNTLSPTLSSDRRLLVPILNPESDLTDVPRRLWELANSTGSNIHFIGLCNNTNYEPSFRRILATLSAMVTNGHVIADSEILSGKEWVELLKSRVRTGDMIVCWHEQRAELLQAKLDVPIYCLFQPAPQPESTSNWLSQAIVWLGFIVIILGFFFVQVEIDRYAKIWTTALQTLSVVAEFGLILLWNNLFG